MGTIDRREEKAKTCYRNSTDTTKWKANRKSLCMCIQPMLPGASATLVTTKWQESLAGARAGLYCLCVLMTLTLRQRWKGSRRKKKRLKRYELDFTRVLARAIRMKISKTTSEKSGSCNFCEGKKLLYKIESDGHPTLAIRMCQSCINKLVQKTK